MLFSSNIVILILLGLGKCDASTREIALAELAERREQPQQQQQQPQQQQQQHQPQRQVPLSLWASASHIAAGHGVAAGNLAAVVGDLPSSFIVSFDIFPRSNGLFSPDTWFNVFDLYSRDDANAHTPAVFLCSTQACGGDKPHKLLLQYGQSSFLEGHHALDLDSWQTVLLSVDTSAGAAEVSVSLAVTRANGTSWSVTSSFPRGPVHRRNVLVFASSPHYAPAAVNLRNWKLDTMPGRAFPGLFVDAFRWNSSSSSSSSSFSGGTAAPDEAPARLAEKHTPCLGEGVWRTVENIDHEWRAGSAVAGCASERVLLRFRGYITWPETQEVLFQAEADDGFHLRIGKRAVVGDEGDWAFKTCSSVEAGRHRFREGVSEPLEAWYFQASGDASASLRFSVDQGRSWAAVPASRLHRFPGAML